MSDKLKPLLLVAMLVVAGAFPYRILTDEQVSTIGVRGLASAFALLVFTLVSDRVTELSAGYQGVSAKLSQLDKHLAEVRPFLFGSIDDDSVTTFRTIASGPAYLAGGPRRTRRTQRPPTNTP